MCLNFQYIACVLHRDAPWKLSVDCGKTAYVSCKTKIRVVKFSLHPRRRSLEKHKTN